jgi:hypothetical protein
MGMFMAFVAGWFIGTRTSRKELEELSRSLRALGKSEEFADLLIVARSHLGHTLRELALMVDGSESLEQGDQDLVDQVRSLFVGE